jgi:hypothetical protein
MDVQELFRSVAAKLRADFEGMSSQIEHRGVKGSAREEALVELYLSRYLPRNVQALHTAEIVASNGSVSKECDIVVVDPMTPPFVDGGGYRVVPVECLYAVIEVKSMLDQRGLADAHEKIKTAKSLPKRAYFPQGFIQHSTTAYGRTFGYFPTAGYVFAYDSIDLRVLSAALRQLQSTSDPQEWIDGIFVLDKGLISYWSDAEHAIRTVPDTDTRARAFASSNPLLLATILLHAHMQGAWMPHFKMLDYVAAGLRMAESIEA